MKTNVKRAVNSVLAIMLAACMMFLCACQKTSIGASPLEDDLIASIEKRNVEKDSNKERAVKTNIYFDNTMGMNGFVCAGPGVHSQ